MGICLIYAKNKHLNDDDHNNDDNDNNNDKIDKVTFFLCINENVNKNAFNFLINICKAYHSHFIIVV
jgi:hypothetical protein